MCGLIAMDLYKAHEESQKKYRLTKSARDKKLKYMEGVQKAQTKRWLKNEYSVALRAGVEDEVETVCGHDTLSTSRELQGACRDFLEEHEEATVRAVLDGTSEEMCATAVAAGIADSDQIVAEGQWWFVIRATVCMAVGYWWL